MSLMYLTLPLISATAVSIMEELPFGTCLFETASAIGTVGLNIPPDSVRAYSQDKNEAEIAEWAFRNQTAVGAHTDKFKEARSLYHPICINGYCYGVVAIYLNGESLESFEYSVFHRS